MGDTSAGKSVALSQSFSIGKGYIEHNLRITKGDGIRQNGIQERRDWNEHLIWDKTITGGDYSEKLLHKVIRKRIGKKLDEYNEKQLQTRHPERVKTYEQWFESVRAKCIKKDDGQITHEYVVQIGNRYTGCPWEMETDSDGNIIDINGKKVRKNDTRQQPAYKNGKPKESKRCKLLKKIYREYLKEFQRANPRLVVLCASIHADELGGVHMHLTCVFFSDTDEGIGIGLGYTSALAQQYASQGIKTKNKQKNNATTLWIDDMKYLLKDVAARHGVEKLDMENKEPHRSIKGFKQFKDIECELEQQREELEEQQAILYEKQLAYKEKERKQKAKEKAIEKQAKALEKKEKEQEEQSQELAKRLQVITDKEEALSKDIVKQEWLLLKTQRPEVYKTIHTEYIKTRKNVKKGLDREDGCML